MVRRVLLALVATALLAAPALGATTAPVKKSATYTGKTSQGQVCRHGGEDGQQCDITFKTSKDRKQVSKLTIRWRGGPCSDNPERYYRAATDFVRLPISSKYGFKFSGSYDATLDDGTKAHNTVKLSGRFTRTSSGKYRAAGGFSVVSDLVLPDGTKTHCESGKVTWTAKPAK